MNEEAANETLFGYPYVACEYEREIDCFLVVSEQLRDFLINSGVNEERIRIGRNAPVVRPATREQALLLADRKAARQLCADDRFELLFVGRLDFQKGLSRLAAFIRLADREGINLGLRSLDRQLWMERGSTGLHGFGWSRPPEIRQHSPATLKMLTALSYCRGGKVCHLLFSMPWRMDV